MSSIWNLLNPLRTGAVKLANGGKELFGTVVNHGKMDKTISVRVDFRYWNNKYRYYYHSSSKFLAHDQENYCISGDKVIIKACRPWSARKHYYVRNVVKAFPRSEYYDELNKKRDEIFEDEYKKVLGQLMKGEYKNAFIKNKKQDAELRSLYKAKALSKARLNIKKNEALRIRTSNREANAQARSEARLKNQAGQQQPSEKANPETF